MSIYIWGAQFIPRAVLEDNEGECLVRVDGELRAVPKSQICGQVHSGDRVRVLLSGGNWYKGTVLDGTELRVRFDEGFEVSIGTVRNMQQLTLFEPVTESDKGNNFSITPAQGSPIQGARENASHPPEAMPSDAFGVREKGMNFVHTPEPKQPAKTAKTRPTLYFDIPAGAKPAKCKGCGADIFWIKTDKGKSMPVDPEDGQAHWGTCPQAKQFGKGAKGRAKDVPKGV